jgi:hypothetical protein
VYLNIEYDQNVINENINLNLRKNIYVREMIKDIIDNFNSSFEEKQIKIKLKPEGLGYQLIEYQSLDNKSKKPLSKNLKLCDLNIKSFKLKYDPQDIMINFQKKSNLLGCFSCPIC